VDVRGIVLVGGAPQHAAVLETFAGYPLATCEVLGRPVVHRVVERLQAQGVTDIAVISESSMPPLAARSRTTHEGLKFLHVPEAHLWRAAENVFSEHAQSGADEVLVLRLGGYAELVVEEFLQHHLDGHARVTRAVLPDHVLPDQAELDVLLVAASRRNDAAYLFRHRLRASRIPCDRWPLRGYWNALQTLCDLRRLAVDALMQRIELAPAGIQVRPGIWTAPSAKIDRGSRVLAPAFIGERARVRPAAVITRCSVLERHAEVDSGSVIEDSTLLPYSYVGNSLDISHAVVGEGRLASLPRNLEMEITDPKLINTLPPHAPLRVLGAALSLAAFLPARLLRSVFATSHRKAPAELPAAAGAPSAALNPPGGFEASREASSFPANIMVARRYGDQ
jgi:NDP-sugar pyrophosphorylase family protein